MRWPLRPLADIAEVLGGGTPSRIVSEYWDGNIPWVTPTDLPMPGKGIADVSDTEERITEQGLAGSSATRLPVGSVLYSSRATIGKIGIARAPLATNQGFVNFIPKPGIDTKYLAYTLLYFTPEISQMAGSTTFKEVRRGALKHFRVPVPPLSEQRRIVEILDQADALRKKRAEADAKTARILPALFYEMFGVPATNPKDWPIYPIEQIARDRRRGVTTGPFGTQLGSKDFVDVGPEVFGIYSIDSLGRFRSGGEKRIAERKYAELVKFDVKADDILISRMGTVGKICLVLDEGARGIVSYHLIRVRSNSELCLPRYLADYLSVAELAGSGLSRSAKGAIMGGINASIVAKYPVFVPPLSLQHKYITQITKVYAMRERQAEDRQRIDRLAATLLHRAFSGILTVNATPNITMRDANEPCHS